jgi:hypothetical protein
MIKVETIYKTTDECVFNSLEEAEKTLRIDYGLVSG